MFTGFLENYRERLPTSRNSREILVTWLDTHGVALKQWDPCPQAKQPGSQVSSSGFPSCSPVPPHPGQTTQKNRSHAELWDMPLWWRNLRFGSWPQVGPTRPQHWGQACARALSEGAVPEACWLIYSFSGWWASLAELRARALQKWRRILFLIVCLNRVDLEGGKVGDQQATKLAADVATPKGPCLFLSVSLSSGELGFPHGEINFKPDPVPCTLCIRLPGNPVCQGPFQFRATVLEQLLTSLPFSLKSVPVGMAQHILALRLEPLLFTQPPAASLKLCLRAGRGWRSAPDPWLTQPQPLHTALLVQGGTFSLASLPETKHHLRVSVTLHAGRSSPCPALPPVLFVCLFLCFRVSHLLTWVLLWNVVNNSGLAFFPPQSAHTLGVENSLWKPTHLLSSFWE